MIIFFFWAVCAVYTPIVRKELVHVSVSCLTIYFYWLYVCMESLYNYLIYKYNIYAEKGVAKKGDAFNNSFRSIGCGF